MFPIEAPDLRQRVLKEIIPTYLRDNTRTRILQPDGNYVQAVPDGQTPHRSQEEFLAIREKALETAPGGGENGTPIEHAARRALNS